MFQDSIIVTVQEAARPADKTSLNSLITDAEVLRANAKVGDEPGQYPAEALEALQSAIDAAREVAENEASVQAEVNEAITSLEDAIDVFKESVNKEEEPEPTEDTEALIWQVGHVVTASNVGTTSVTLTWDAAVDNVGVAGYKVTWRISTKEQIRELGKDTTSITINGLQSSMSYTFKMEAHDAAGNWSEDGPSVTVKTKSSYVPPVEPEQPIGTSEPTRTTRATEPARASWSA